MWNRIKSFLGLKTSHTVSTVPSDMSEQKTSTDQIPGKEMSDYILQQVPHKKKLVIYTLINGLLNPSTTILRSHLEFGSGVGLGAFAVASSAQASFHEIKANKEDELMRAFELNIIDSAIAEIRKKPIVEQKAFPADEQYKRAQQLGKYGTDFIFSKMRILGACIGSVCAAGVLACSALLAGPSAFAVSAIAAAVSTGVTLFIAPKLGEKRRRLTLSQEGAINEQAVKITAKQKNQCRNGRVMALYPELREQEITGLKNDEKGMLSKLKRMYQSVRNVWIQYGLAMLGTTALMACSGFASGAFVLGSAITGVITGGIISASVINFVNGLKDKRISLDMYYKTHRLLEHRAVFNVQTGNKNIDNIARPVIRLENVAHQHRNIHIPDSIDGIPNPDFGARSEKDAFVLNGRIDIGTGITVLGGDSGTGKSTLVSLLMHEDDVTRGSISVGTYNRKGDFVGSDLRELDPDSYARQISYQMVNPEWVACSVKEYITGFRQVDSAKLKKICDILEIKEKGANGLSLERQIDPSDPKFSEGEQKRLAIAQALIKDAPIMIFDEPTANIGEKMTKNLLDYIGQRAADKTIIFISHTPEDLEQLKEVMPKEVSYQALHFHHTQTDNLSGVDYYDLRKPEDWGDYLSKIKVERPRPAEDVSHEEDLHAQSPAEDVSHEEDLHAQIEEQQKMIDEIQTENQNLRNKNSQQQVEINQLYQQLKDLRKLLIVGGLYTCDVSLETKKTDDEEKAEETDVLSDDETDNNPKKKKLKINPQLLQKKAGALSTQSF